MPSWEEMLAQCDSHGLNCDELRSKAVRDLSVFRNRNVICYYSGWLQYDSSSDISICDNDMNGLMNAVHGMDKAKGLDFVMHTPGGDMAATEAIVNYLKDCFGNDVCAVVPHLAMSAGTMIACSCKSIVMGKHSSLGPTDPQLNGVAAGGVVEEFECAVKEIEMCPSSVQLWAQIIGKYHPTFLGDCKKVLDMSRTVVDAWLADNMLKNEQERIPDILDALCSHEKSAMHNRHFSHKTLSDLGLKIEMLEDNRDFQDLVLTAHHAFMISFQSTPCAKIIEGSNGSCWVVKGA